MSDIVQRQANQVSIRLVCYEFELFVVRLVSRHVMLCIHTFFESVHRVLEFVKAVQSKQQRPAIPLLVVIVGAAFCDHLHDFRTLMQ